jgi:hypothetical protein
MKKRPGAKRLIGWISQGNRVRDVKLTALSVAEMRLA